MASIGDCTCEIIQYAHEPGEIQFCPLHDAAADMLEALKVRREERFIVGEYYRQCDLGLPPSQGWVKLTFQDVTKIRVHADQLSMAAIAKAMGKGA